MLCKIGRDSGSHVELERAEQFEGVLFDRRFQSGTRLGATAACEQANNLHSPISSLEKICVCSASHNATQRKSRAGFALFA